MKFFFRQEGEEIPWRYQLHLAVMLAAVTEEKVTGEAAAVLEVILEMAGWER